MLVYQRVYGYYCIQFWRFSSMRIPQVDGPITMDDLGVPPAPIPGYPYIYTYIHTRGIHMVTLNGYYVCIYIYIYLFIGDISQKHSE